MEILRKPVECKSPACSARFFSSTSLLKVKVKHSDVSPRASLVSDFLGPSKFFVSDKLPARPLYFFLSLLLHESPFAFLSAFGGGCSWRFAVYSRYCYSFLVSGFSGFNIHCLHWYCPAYTVYGSNFFSPNLQLLRRPKILITQLSEICS
jgi:hypothetical protein